MRQVCEGAAIFLDYQPTESSPAHGSKIVWRCAPSGARVLAAGGCDFGRDNPACYICAVRVPARWGSDGGDGFYVGQLTDVRVARLNTRSN